MSTKKSVDHRSLDENPLAEKALGQKSIGQKLVDQNVNNPEAQGSSSDEHNGEIPQNLLVQLIIIAISELDDESGSTLKDIRKFLWTAGLISESTCLRRAMVSGLKSGRLARPEWACKAGVYGRYVLGDNIPVFAGRKSRPLQLRHRSSSASSSRRPT
ncbi:unnamed protein product [Candidula unifasciata]|uniref:Uncharacterized protein n=1 Tax=Candidula unifasciata TaxID=100452 RepID=A0A8S3ZT10_9EUPU|nr:unnamed protein product [Candidula unifasciata]